MNRYRRPACATVLVAALVVAAFGLGQHRPDGAAEAVSIADPGLLVAAPAGATATPTASPTPARPSANAIYKGYTLEEIRAEPALLEEVNALSDYLRPTRDEPDPPLPDFGSDTVCPNHVGCP